MTPKLIFPFAYNNRLDQVTKFDRQTTWGYTKDNKDFIDLSLGSCGSFPLGFKRQDFAEYVASKSKDFAHLSGEFLTTNDTILNLSDTYYNYSNGYRSIFSLSGSDAVESAIRIASLYHKLNDSSNKTLMLGFEDSYHGSTYMSSSISGSTYFHHLFGRHPMCVTLSYDIVSITNRIYELGPDNISCLIVETCSWQAGLYEQSEDWWKAIRKICRENNIIFIVDDIAFSGAKTSRFFGYTPIAEPDIVCFGKAISGGYYPLSGVLVNDKLYTAIQDIKFTHGFTYSFSQSGMLSALYYNEVVKNENILENFDSVHQAGATLVENLKNIKCVSRSRNYGMLWCLDLDIKPYTDTEISNVFLNNGLYLGLWNDISRTPRILLQMPTVYDEVYINQLQSRLQNTLSQLV